MDVRQIIEALGTKATAAATGAVSTSKYFMAYIKQIVTLAIAIKERTDLIPDDPADQSEIIAEIDANETLLNTVLDEILGTDRQWSNMQGEAISSLDLALQYLAAVIGMNGANTFGPVVGGVARTSLERVYNALDYVLQVVDANIDWIKEAAGNDNWGFGALRNHILANKALLDTISTNVDWIKEAAGNDDWGFGALRNEINANETKLDALIVDIASAVPEPPTAKSLQDILHKDTNYTYSKATDALEAISDEVHRLHQHVYILFIIPEAVGSINADNQVLLAELQKLGHVHTITQGDALDFPAFGMYGLAVCGTNSGTAWTPANLADLKMVLGLPILCVDKVSAAYFEMGTDGGDASTKTVIRAISEIEGTIMGRGESAHETITGLAAGNNTVSGSATYHTLDMSDTNITEKVFCTEAEDPDDQPNPANEDVVMGLIPRVLEDGSIGVDEEGADVPATLGFLGFCYDASELTTLGKGAFYLFAHMMVMTQIQMTGAEVNATIVDLRKRLLGNMKNLFTNTSPLAEYIAGQDSVGTKLPVGTSLYDILVIIDGIVDTLATDTDPLVAGKVQPASTTESLNQAAGTYDLFTGTDQAVKLISLSIKMPTGAAGGSITSISIQTDDATPGVIIPATLGAVANLTSEAELFWEGTMLINTGTKIQLTIAGGAHGSAYTATIVAECRAVVSGGYLA